MTLEIQKQENHDLATPSSSVLSLDPSAIPYIQLPRLTLLQGSADMVTKEKHQLGTFYNNVMNVNYGETIEVIPFGKVKSGALYIPKGTKKMKCKSSDGVHSIRGDLCANCPFGVSHKGAWVNNEPPGCATTLDFYVMIVKDMTPALLTFKRTSLKTGQRIMTQLALSKLPLALTLGARSEERPGGIYQALRVVSQRPVSGDELKEIDKMNKMLSQAHVEVEDGEGVEDDF